MLLTESQQLAIVLQTSSEYCPTHTVCLLLADALQSHVLAKFGPSIPILVSNILSKLHKEMIRFVSFYFLLLHSNHCLFSVPANQAFVYIASGSEPEQTPMDVLTSSFRNDLKTGGSFNQEN